MTDNEKWTDEQIASRLEHPLYQFLKQNTDFFTRNHLQVTPETLQSR